MDCVTQVKEHLQDILRRKINKKNNNNSNSNAAMTKRAKHNHLR